MNQCSAYVGLDIHKDVVAAAMAPRGCERTLAKHRRMHAIA